MKIRLILNIEADAREWARMRHLLWPTSTEQEHDAEITNHLKKQNPDAEVFVIDLGHDQLGGFLEVGIRSYAEGCNSDQVGYIEGWYVEPDLREQGLGGQLLSAAEEWAQQKGLTEMASDSLIDNEIGIQAHLALGYKEVEKMVCFRKIMKN